MYNTQTQSNARDILDLYYKVTDDVAEGKRNADDREMLDNLMVAFRSSLGFNNDQCGGSQYYNWVNDTICLCRIIVSRPI